MKPKEFATLPTVYAVGSNYRIIVPVTCETVMWVRVGDRNFYDDSNGILRSSVTTHHMTVPMELLDRIGTYTVCYRTVEERKPYFSQTGDVMEYTSAFRPIPKEGAVRIYHIADAHNRTADAIAAGRYFGEVPNLLILNGDIPNHSGTVENMTAIHEIAAGITKGEIPAVFSRGNHDTRGIFAEQLEDHVPTDNGKSYYTFRVGHIWGMVLDCGEDKRDDHAEYGHTVCFEDFRRRETEFIQEVIAHAKNEYEEDGVKNRIVICHIPFTETPKPPFDIEIETYTEWARLLREHVKPQIMLCGHEHTCYISPIGCERDQKGQPCPVIVASELSKGEPYIGGAIELYENGCTVKFTDQNGNIKETSTLSF